jgi:hypothetical protein
MWIHEYMFKYTDAMREQRGHQKKICETDRQTKSNTGSKVYDRNDEFVNGWIDS